MVYRTNWELNKNFRKVTKNETKFPFSGVSKIKRKYMGRMKSDKGPDYKKKGKPSGGNDPVTGLREVHVDQLEQEEEISDKYTEGPDEQPAENLHVKHPNRNLNKPDIDKPPY